MPTNEKTKDWYEKNAEAYAAHVRDPKNSPYHAYYEKPAMRALLPDLKDMSVLSVGCGSGEDSNYLKTHGAQKSIGIDTSGALIKIATDTYPDCEFRIMDMEKLDFPDAHFDFVYSSLAIHYVEDWTGVFKEVFRVLKPRSYFLFSCGHPARFAMDDASDDAYSILKLEMSKNKNTKELIITGDYLAKRKITNLFGDNTVDTWTMPLGDIAKNATDAGFLIERLVEPRPVDALKEINPTVYYRLSKIPDFMIFRLMKI